MILSDVKSSGDRFLVPNPLTVLKRNRIPLGISAAAGVALGAIGYWNAPPHFVSEAVLVLDARRIQALPTEAVVSALPQESPVLRSEIDIIGSTTMALKVAERLQQSEANFPSETTHRDNSSDSARTARGSTVEVEPATSVPQGSPAAQQLARRLAAGLNVTNDGHSYTIHIAFRDGDPAFAAKAADAFAHTYIDYQTEVQQRETLRVSNWLGGKLESLRARLEASEKAGEEFRRSAGLVKIGSTSLPAQRVARLGDELVQAGAALAGAQARLDAARNLLSRADVPALGEFLQSDAIQALRSKQGEAERKLASIVASGASKNDQIPLLNAEIGAYKHQVALEVQSILESLQNEVAIATQKRDSVNAALDDAKARLAEANGDEVRLGQLQREADADRSVYESYLASYKQAIEQQGVVTPEARVISTAQATTRLEGPNLTNWLMFGLTLGVAAGAVGVLWREFNGGIVRSPQRLAASSGLPIVGYVPKLSRSQRTDSPSAARDARTPLGRSFGALWAVIRAGQEKEHSSAFAIASPRAGEGKTSVSVGLARHIATSGKKVVVVDANLRAPRVAKEFGVTPERYIDEILEPGLTPSTLLYKDPHSEACFIAARRHAATPEFLLSSRSFQSLIDDLKQWFDVVLIDTADLENFSDALQASGAADYSLLVVDAAMSGPELVAAATDSLTACRRRPLGILFNRFKPAQEISPEYSKRMRRGATTGPKVRVFDSHPEVSL